MLYQYYVNDIWCFAHSKVNSEETADEIASAAWSVVVEKIHDYRWTGQPLKAWLMTICWNKIREYWRETQKEDKSLDAIDSISIKLTHWPRSP